MAQWLDSVDENLVFISVVTLGELRKGCELLDAGKRRSELEQWLEVEVREWFTGRILPVTNAIAERWGRLEAKRQRLGGCRSISPMDRLPPQLWNMALRSLHGMSMTSGNWVFRFIIRGSSHCVMTPDCEPASLECWFSGHTGHSAALMRK